MHDAIRSPSCPVCGLPGAPIAYGYPSPEMFRARDRGEVVLGGCVIEPEMPTHECPVGHRWEAQERQEHRAPGRVRRDPDAAP